MMLHFFFLLILTLFACEATHFRIIDSVSCETEDFMETEDLYCAGEESWMEEKKGSSRRRSRHKQTDRHSKGSNGHHSSPRRKTGSSHSNELSSVDGESLTAKKCTRQRIELLKLNKSYHQVEQKMHSFAIDYSNIWETYYQIQKNYPCKPIRWNEPPPISESGRVTIPERLSGCEDFLLLSTRFKQIRLDFDNIIDVEHSLLNQKYLKFKKGQESADDLEDIIDSHNKNIDSIRGKWNHLLMDWWERQAEKREVPDNFPHKMIVENDRLLEKSYDFAITICRKLSKGYQLTSEGEGLIKEYNNLWQENDRLLEKYNKDGRDQTGQDRLNNAKAINALEKQLLKELKR